MKKFFYLSLLMAMPAMAQQNNRVATFEDLPLEQDSFWNGSDGTGGFISGSFRFENKPIYNSNDSTQIFLNPISCYTNRTPSFFFSLSQRHFI